MLLEGAPPRQKRRSTGVLIDAPTPDQRKDQRQLADQIYHSAMTDLARGRAGFVQPSAGPKFADCADWYAKHVIPQHRGAERERELLATLRAGFGPRHLLEITGQVVDEWATTRSAKASYRTINREIDLLKAMLRKAVENGEITASPIAGRRRYRVLKPRRRLMTAREEMKLLAKLAPDDTAIFLLALDSLIRFGDILDLQWADWQGSSVYIRDPKDPVQGEPYEVPISKRGQAALEVLPVNGPYLFPRRRKNRTEHDRRKAYRQRLARACKQAGIPYGRTAGGLTFHWATRRTGATRMIQAGIDPATVQAVGHWQSPAVVLGIYAEGNRRTARRAVEIPGGQSRRRTQPKKGVRNSRKRR
jgi:integrase